MIQMQNGIDDLLFSKRLNVICMKWNFFCRLINPQSERNTINMIGLATICYFKCFFLFYLLHYVSVELIDWAIRNPSSSSNLWSPIFCTKLFRSERYWKSEESTEIQYFVICLIDLHSSGTLLWTPLIRFRPYNFQAY